MEGSDELLPFVSQLYGSPSTYLWEDEEGGVHEIRQGEGGEQGDVSDAGIVLLGAGDPSQTETIGAVDGTTSGVSVPLNELQQVSPQSRKSC